MPAISSGNATLSMTVRQGKVDSSWKIIPIEGCGPRDPLARDLDRALVAVEQPADDVEQRGLAAARGADHAQELAGIDRERDMIDRRDRAVRGLEALDDVLDDEDRLAWPCSRHGRTHLRPDGIVTAAMAALAPSCLAGTLLPTALHQRVRRYNISKPTKAEVPAGESVAAAARPRGQ